MFICVCVCVCVFGNVVQLLSSGIPAHLAACLGLEVGVGDHGATIKGGGRKKVKKWGKSYILHIVAVTYGIKIKQIFNTTTGIVEFERQLLYS